MRDKPLSHAAFSSAPVQVSSANLEQALDISPDALVVIDQGGTVVALNGQVAGLFGYSRTELLGQPIEMFLPEQLRALHSAHRANYFAAPRTRPMGAGLQLVGKRKDGIEIDVDISLRSLLLDGVPHAVAAVRDVTAQKVAERERAQQLQQIRLQAGLINLAQDAFFVRDLASRVIFWNRGAEELYGWSVQEALGRVAHLLLKTRFPINRSAVEEQVERDGQWVGELEHTCRDGRVVTVESHWALVRDDQGQPFAILEVNRDITQRRRIEQAAQAAQSETAAHLAFLRDILDALPGSVYLVRGPEARLVLANRAARGVWGAEWQADQPILEFLAGNNIAIADAQGHPIPPDGYATLRAVRLSETTQHHQETIRRPDGSSLPVLVNALAMPAQQADQENMALVVHQDVTALKEAEYLKDEFVGIVAHELRTPLAALRGFADMLLVQTARGHGPDLAGWQQEALEEIEQATIRLSRLTDDLLDVTRVQAGRLLLHRAPTDVAALAKRVAALLQQTTTRHQLEVRIQCPALLADIDPGRIDQVLTNIIGNAIKYSPRGGPVIITIWEDTTYRAACISVRDEGIGIPRRQHAQIFGRFMRADNASAWSISGTGLGLYLCRELVERHGGNLWFESEEGKGSTFFLTLPLAH